MSRFDKAGADRKRGAIDFLNPQVVETERRGDDIDDGIDPSYLVEMDMADLRPVHPRFRFGQPEENPLRRPFDVFRQGTSFDQPGNVGIMAMGLVLPHLDSEPGGTDTLPLGRFHADAVCRVGQGKPAETLFQSLQRNPQIKERGNSHVAGYACEAVNVKYVHRE